MSSQFLRENTVGNSMKHFTKIQLNIHSLRVHHFVTEKDHVSQAGFVLHILMLDASDHSIVPYVLCNDIQDNIFHNLP